MSPTRRVVDVDPIHAEFERGLAQVDSPVFELNGYFGRDPAGGARVNLGDGFYFGKGGAAQGRTSFADLAQRPVDGFPHEIPFVRRLTTDDGQELDENLVGQIFSPDGHSGHDNEACAFHEFWRLRRPVQRFFDGEGRNQRIPVLFEPGALDLAFYGSALCFGGTPIVEVRGCACVAKRASICS